MTTIAAIDVVTIIEDAMITVIGDVMTTVTVDMTTIAEAVDECCFLLFVSECS